MTDTVTISVLFIRRTFSLVYTRTNTSYQFCVTYEEFRKHPAVLQETEMPHSFFNYERAARLHLTTRNVFNGNSN